MAKGTGGSRKPGSKRGRLKSSALRGRYVPPTLLPPPLSVVFRRTEVEITIPPEFQPTLEDVMVDLVFDSIKRLGLTLIYAVAIMEQARERTGRTGTYGRPVYEKVAKRTGTKLIKRGNTFYFKKGGEAK